MHGTEVVSLDVWRSARTQFLRTAREEELAVVADLDPGTPKLPEPITANPAPRR